MANERKKEKIINDLCEQYAIDTLMCDFDDDDEQDKIDDKFHWNLMYALAPTPSRLEKKVLKNLEEKIKKRKLEHEKELSDFNLEMKKSKMEQDLALRRAELELMRRDLALREKELEIKKKELENEKKLKILELEMKERIAMQELKYKSNCE